MAPTFKQSLEDIEEILDSYYTRFKPVIPTIAKFLLLSTFIDDGIRMLTHWDEQHRFFNRRFPSAICSLILLINCSVQLGASALILTKKFRLQASCALFFIVIFQTIIYSPLWTANLLMRNLALCGSLLLLLADARASNDRKNEFAGIPTFGVDNVKDYMLFFGRVMLVIMFFSLIHSNMSTIRWLLTMINFGLIVCVVIGTETKLAAFLLVMILTLENMFMNAFWAVPSWAQDYVRYDFFQTLSVIGGLLLVVYHGAGDLSIDQQKKEY